jgi:hypothetical protein
MQRMARLLCLLIPLVLAPWGGVLAQRADSGAYSGAVVERVRWSRVVGEGQLIRHAPVYGETLYFDSAGRVINRRILNALSALDGTPVVRLPARRQVGARWREPIAEQSESPDWQSVWLLSGTALTQRMTGRRDWLIAGDTLIEGVRHWILHDDAAVTVSEVLRREGEGFDSAAVTRREWRGTIRGRSIVDSLGARLVWRRDTVVLRGEVRNERHGLPPMRVALRYHGARSVRAMTPGAYAQLEQEEARRRRATSTAPVWAPTSPLGERLHAGDAALRDSLARAWTAGDDSTRLMIQGLFPFGTDALIDSLRDADGDLRHRYQQLENGPPLSNYTNEWPQLDGPLIDSLLGLVRDPRPLLKVGQGESGIVGRLEGLVRYVPYGPSGLTDPSICAAGACERIMALWPGDPDARLRDLGLLLRFRLQPSRYLSALVARQRSSPSTLLDVEVSRLTTRGIVSQSGEVLGGGIPPRGAGATDWIAYLTPLQPLEEGPLELGSGFGGDRAPGALRRFYIDTIGLNLARLLTGRDALAEMRVLRDRAAHPDTVAILSLALAALGESTASVAELAEMARAGGAVQRWAATAHLRELHRARADPRRGESPVTDSAAVGRLLLAVLRNMRSEESASWSPLESRRADYVERRTFRRDSAGAPRPAHRIAAQSVPLYLRDSLPEGIVLVTAEEWDREPIRSAGSLLSIHVWTDGGDFASVTMGTAGRLAQASDEAPHRFASSSTWHLVRIDGQWYVLSTSYWIT